MICKYVELKSTNTKEFGGRVITRTAQLAESCLQRQFAGGAASWVPGCRIVNPLKALKVFIYIPTYV